MRYWRNTVTGAEIRTECEISGENWQEVNPPAGSTEVKGRTSKKAPSKSAKQADNPTAEKADVE